jgi:hypothetical protein
MASFAEETKEPPETIELQLGEMSKLTLAVVTESVNGGPEGGTSSTNAR